MSDFEVNFFFENTGLSDDQIFDNGEGANSLHFYEKARDKSIFKFAKLHVLRKNNLDQDQ